MDQASPIFSAVLGTVLHVLYFPCYLALLDSNGTNTSHDSNCASTRSSVREPQDWAQLSQFLGELGNAILCRRTPQAESRRMVEAQNQASGPVWVGTASMFWLLWSIANISYISSLALVDAGIVTALFNTAPAWVAILSYCFLSPSERPPHVAIGAVAAVLAVGGAGMVVLGTSSSGAPGGPLHMSGSRSIVGCGLALIAALAAAAYKVLYRRVYGASTVRLAFLLLSSIGAIMLLIGWAIVLAVLQTGW